MCKIKENTDQKYREKSINQKLFFDKINKIDKSLVGRTEKKKQKTQIARTRNEKRNITTNLMEIKRILKEYQEQLYVNKLGNLDEIDKFLERNKYLTQEENR